jgi:hypothetical protein
MPFAAGNQFAKGISHRRTRVIQQHLIAALNEVDTDNIPKLRRVVDALIAKAMEGDIAAIKEIADRVDGKVPQQVQGDAEAPLVIDRVVREIVYPKRTIEDALPLTLVKGGE